MNEDTLKKFNASLLVEAIYRNGSTWARISGKSMLPILFNRAIIKIILCPFKEIGIGDLVVFKAQDSVICHRLFKKINSGGGLFLKTKGDTASVFDPLVTESEIIGKVITFKKGWLHLNLNNPLSRLIGLFMGAGLPLAARLSFYWKTFKNNIWATS